MKRIYKFDLRSFVLLAMLATFLPIEGVQAAAQGTAQRAGLSALARGVGSFCYANRYQLGLAATATVMLIERPMRKKLLESYRSLSSPAQPINQHSIKEFDIEMHSLGIAKGSTSEGQTYKNQGLDYNSMYQDFCSIQNSTIRSENYRSYVDAHGKGISSIITKTFSKLIKKVKDRNQHNIIPSNNSVLRLTVGGTSSGFCYKNGRFCINLRLRSLKNDLNMLVYHCPDIMIGTVLHELGHAVHYPELIKSRQRITEAFSAVVLKKTTLTPFAFLMSFICNRRYTPLLIGLAIFEKLISFIQQRCLLHKFDTLKESNHEEEIYADTLGWCDQAEDRPFRLKALSAVLCHHAHACLAYTEPLTYYVSTSEGWTHPSLEKRVIAIAKTFLTLWKAEKYSRGQEYSNIKAAADELLKPLENKIKPQLLDPAIVNAIRNTVFVAMGVQK